MEKQKIEIIGEIQKEILINGHSIENVTKIEMDVTPSLLTTLTITLICNDLVVRKDKEQTTMTFNGQINAEGIEDCLETINKKADNFSAK